MIFNLTTISRMCYYELYFPIGESNRIHYFETRMEEKMGKFLAALVSIGFIIFSILKWGGLIVGILGTIAAIVIGAIFIGGGDA